MNLLSFLKNLTSRLSLCLCLLLPLPSWATTVQVQTSQGNFVINLFDFDAQVKLTVDNFLAYVNANAYDDTFFHRSDPGFVLQGGGFVYGGMFPAPQDTDLGLIPVQLVAGQENTTIINQPRYSSVRGTVAMAKIGNDPDSASNQWFINLNDNATALDLQNGGFTVFGIVESGMDVVNAIVAYNLLSPGYPSPLDELPLQNYTNDDFTNNVVPDDTNLAIINTVTVLDSSVDTAADLDLVLNELFLGFRPTPVITQPEFKDGGNVGIVGLVLLVSLLTLRRRFQNR